MGGLHSDVDDDWPVSPHLLHLLQLASPSLPVGAFAYSRGQEWAVHAGWLTGENEANRWISGLLNHSLVFLDLPIVARLCKGWQAKDLERVEYWSAYLLASREAAEFRAEEVQLGKALARLLAGLDLAEAREWTMHPKVSYAAMFALASVKWRIPVKHACAGYAWSWIENQVAAAVKLIPLGQTAGQKILARTGAEIAGAVDRALSVADEDIGYLSVGLACAGALHETQHTRLFRS